LVVPGHIAMDKSRRNHAVGRTRGRARRLQRHVEEPGIEKAGLGAAWVGGDRECPTAPAWRCVPVAIVFQSPTDSSPTRARTLLVLKSRLNGA
jgi:hypothetical protein